MNVMRLSLSENWKVLQKKNTSSLQFKKQAT